MHTDSDRENDHLDSKEMDIMKLNCKDGQSMELAQDHVQW
jgi:hypothetical protein